LIGLAQTKKSMVGNSVLAGCSLIVAVRSPHSNALAANSCSEIKFHILLIDRPVFTRVKYLKTKTDYRKDLDITMNPAISLLYRITTLLVSKTARER